MAARLLTGSRLLALLAVSAAGIALGCGNSNSVTATPTPTPTPSGTPTPAGTTLTYTLSVSPPSQTCNAGTVTETWGAPSVTVDLSSGQFRPEWNLAGTDVLVQPAGTVTGNNFSANWTWCATDISGTFTTRHEWTWSGTLSTDRKTFTNSTMLEVMKNAAGAGVACASVASSMADCTSPGLTWTVSGTAP